MNNKFDYDSAAFILSACVLGIVSTCLFLVFSCDIHFLYQLWMDEHMCYLLLRKHSYFWFYWVVSGGVAVYLTDSFECSFPKFDDWWHKYCTLMRHYIFFHHYNHYIVWWLRHVSTVRTNTYTHHTYTYKCARTHVLLTFDFHSIEIENDAIKMGNDVWIELIMRSVDINSWYAIERNTKGREAIKTNRFGKNQSDFVMDCVYSKSCK